MIQETVPLIQYCWTIELEIDEKGSSGLFFLPYTMIRIVVSGHPLLLCTTAFCISRAFQYRFQPRFNYHNVKDDLLFFYNLSYLTDWEVF
jgi:hypothetical protein